MNRFRILAICVILLKTELVCFGRPVEDLPQREGNFKEKNVVRADMENLIPDKNRVQVIRLNTRFQAEQPEVRKILAKLDAFLRNDSAANDTLLDSNRTWVYSEKYFQGDIMLSVEQAQRLFDFYVHGNDRRKKRKFVNSSVRKWDPKKPIKYAFDGTHNFFEQRRIESILRHWEAVSCINFVRTFYLSPDENGILFTNTDGCASTVGKNQYKEPQYLSLSYDCFEVNGIVAHEIAHTLGFFHEQSRPDRDVYVTIQWANVRLGQELQFRIEPWDMIDTAGITYDPGSVMHYRSKAYANREGAITIRTNNPFYQYTIGQRDQLSFNDKRLINKIYCKRHCPRRLACRRDGFPHPRHCNLCMCPDGFTGQLCEKIMPGYMAQCGGEIHLNSQWDYINSPNYPDLFEEGQECSWLLIAREGEIVELEFIGDFSLFCNERKYMCMDYVEIRVHGVLSNTGMRLCCDGAPEDSFYSRGREMLVLFRSFYRPRIGFQARIRSRPRF